MFGASDHTLGCSIFIPTIISAIFVRLHTTRQFQSANYAIKLLQVRLRCEVENSVHVVYVSLLPESDLEYVRLYYISP